MIFGRKRRPADDHPGEPIADSATPDESDSGDAEEVVEFDAEELAEELQEEVAGASFDAREDGPFDIDEVELDGDEVQRIDLGTLILTPWPGLNLQLQVQEPTKRVRMITGIWRKSGIEVALYAAPASGGLAAEQQEELIEQAQQSGGSAEVGDGPFGPELRRILPQTGPKGEQLFQVSRVWFAEGPRWLLRGTLLGEAALPDGDAKARPFIEFFRNLVVRRGQRPMVPGELLTMDLPKQAQG